MKYELRDGKYYEIKEVNLVEIEKEVKQVITYVQQQEASKKPYDDKVISLQREKEKKLAVLQNEILVVTEQYNTDIKAYQEKSDEYKVLIDNAKTSLKEKEEIIKGAFPNESQNLGL